MIMEEDLKESIGKHIQLIKSLSSLSNVQAIVFVNILSIDNPDMFNKLKEITEWESKILSKFMKESEQADEKKKDEPKKEPKKEHQKEPKKKPKDEPKKKPKDEPKKKPKDEPKKKPQKELKRASDDMFDKSEYDRIQIGGEQK